MKKRRIISLIAVSSIMLFGCAPEGPVPTSSTGPENVDESKKETVIALDLMEEKVYIESRDDGEFRVIYYGKVHNSSDQSVYFGGGEITVEKTDGTILEVVEVFDGFPQIVEAGGTSYFSSNFSIENLKSEEEIGKITSKLEIEESVETTTPLEISNMQLLPDKMTTYKVTGILKNSTTNPMESIEVAVALLDENDEMLALLFAYPDDLEAGEELAVEINPIGFLPEEVKDKVKSFDILAVNID